MATPKAEQKYQYAIYELIFLTIRSKLPLDKLGCCPLYFMVQQTLGEEN